MRQIEDRGSEIVDQNIRSAYNEGLESVLYIRCMEHRAEPAYNQSEGNGECAVCAVKERDAVWEQAVLKNIEDGMENPIAKMIGKLKQQHSREIENMAKDAYAAAFDALLRRVKTVGYCAFCGQVVAIGDTLKEAMDGQREHTLGCAEMHRLLEQRRGQ